MPPSGLYCINSVGVLRFFCFFSNERVFPDKYPEAWGKGRVFRFEWKAEQMKSLLKAVFLLQHRHSARKEKRVKCYFYLPQKEENFYNHVQDVWRCSRSWTESEASGVLYRHRNKTASSKKRGQYEGQHLHRNNSRWRRCIALFRLEKAWKLIPNQIEIPALAVNKCWYFLIFKDINN